MTLLAIIFALIFDFFLLPALLIMGGKFRKRINAGSAVQAQPS